MHKNKTQQSILCTILLVFVVSVIIFVAQVKPTHAQFGVVVVEDIPQRQTSIFSRIKNIAGSRAFHQALRSVTFRLARQSAVWLASGDKGKKPLVFQKPLGKALLDIGDEVGGKFLANISAGAPINLCSPSSVNSRLKLYVGVSKSIGDFKLFGDNYCPPGQSTKSIPGRLSKSTLTIKGGAEGDVLKQITVGSANSEILSQPVTWQGDSASTATLLVQRINTSTDFTASKGAINPETGFTNVIISSKKSGTFYNNATISLDLNWSLGDGSTGIEVVSGFSGGTNTTTSGSGGCISNDLGRKGCKLTEIGANFGKVYEDQKKALGLLSDGFSIDNNELGAFVRIKENLARQKQLQKEQEKSERQGEGFKAVKDVITGQVVTPAPLVKETLTASAKKAVEPDTQTTGDLFIDAAQIFANTFAQTYLRRMQKGLLRPQLSRSPGGSGTGEGGLGGAKIGGGLEKLSAHTVSIDSPSEIDLFTDMSICPPPQHKGPYNCLLNDQMQQAVQEELTIQQAIDDGVIDANMRFPEQHDASRPTLSIENLKKLRFLRIIPVGWEIAAQKLASENQTVGFGDLIRCFDAGNSEQGCNVGKESALNDLKKLVDPSWVLMQPQLYCRAKGFSSTTEHEKSPNRREVCVDLQSCVAENTDGSCTANAYGYCTRERSVWDMEGESCPAQAATCRTFTKPRKVSLLSAYVDNQDCVSGSAGCKWYSAVKKQTNNPDDPRDDWIDSIDQNEKIYLNSNAQSCRQGETDVNEVILLVPGVNYIKNGNFKDELLISRPSAFGGSIGGARSPGLGEGGWNQIFTDEQYIPSVGMVLENALTDAVLKPRTYYTLSFNAVPNPNDSSKDSAEVVISAGSSVLKRVSVPPYDFGLVGVMTFPTGTLSNYNSSRFATTFYNTSNDNLLIQIQFNGSSVYGKIKLEEISLQAGVNAAKAVSDFSTASKTIEQNIQNLNVVPQNFSRGQSLINIASPTTAYSDYSENARLVFSGAKECNAEETTARKYTPLSGGKPKIARLTSVGLCSSQCNGFETYLEIPTAIENLAASVLNAPLPRATRKKFIPNLAPSCEARYVGCEAFTNATTEQRVYYNKIESCVLETNPNVATFFTWEGSDFKVWQLLEDSTQTPGKGFGPCTSFPQGSREGVVNPETQACRDSSGGSRTCIGEFGEFCRTFIDGNGNEYVRDSNKIVTASNLCKEFRRTNNQESWFFIPSEANQCPATALSCKEYKGKEANTIQLLMHDDFEEGEDGWDNNGGEVVDLAVENGGKSFRIPAGTDIGKIMNGFDNNLGKSYIVKFRAKAENTTAAIDLIRFKTDAGGTNTVDRTFLREDEPPLQLTSNWRDYVAGPVEYTALGTIHDTLTPTFFIREHAGIGNGNILIDNIELFQVDGVYHKLSNAIAQVSEGGNQPDACYVDASMQSCKQYIDDKNNKYYISSFDKLFPNDLSLTCSAVIDTQNYSYPYSRAFDMGKRGSGSSGEQVPIWYAVGADSYSYRYIDPNKKVAQSSSGCIELGLPVYSDLGILESWQTTYKRIDPDLFTDKDGSSPILCTNQGLWCEEFTTTEGSNYVFKDPKGKTCTWDPNLYGDVGGFVFDNGVIREACRISDGYVPLCEEQYNSCKAYSPTNSKLTEGPTTTLFKLADTVANGECVGGENPDIGCVNFEIGYSSNQVIPEIPESKLDAPTLRVIEVNPSRQCAEWLSPTTYSQAFDQKSRTERTITYDLGRCQRISEDGKCTLWSTGTVENGYPGAYELETGEFKVDLYANRQIGPNGKELTLFSGAWDYTGYSIPNIPPVERLVEDSDAKLLRYNTSGVAINPSGVDTQNGLMCRSYPEEDSPFDSSEIGFYENLQTKERTRVYGGPTKALENTNTCAPDENGRGSSNCICDYKKVNTLESGNLYYSQFTQQIFPKGVQSITDVNGWHGYCLEFDEATTDPNGNPLCVAWWPVDVPQAATNIFDNHPEAGFSTSAPLYYCLEGKGNNLHNPAIGLFHKTDSENNYSISISTNENGSGRESAYDDNFERGTGWHRAVNKEWPYDRFSPDYRLLKSDIGSGFSKGPRDSTGMMQFRVKDTSPLGGLREYDIESVILKTRNAESVIDKIKQWPENGEEFVLNRAGFASGAYTIPDIVGDKKWTALWCGGKPGAQCDFSDEYSWEKFRPYIEFNGDFGGNEAFCYSKNKDEEGNTDTIDATQKTNLFAVRSKFADENGNVEMFFDINGDGDLDELTTGLQPYQFLGFEGGMCDNTKISGWVDFEIIFKLREWCSTVALVNEPGVNKAWTGRVNNKSITDYPFDKSVYDATSSQTERLVGIYTSDFTYNQDNKPFGASVPPSATIYQPDLWDSRADEVNEDDFSLNTQAGEPGKQPLYVEQGEGQVRAGSPYSCGETTESCVVPPIVDAPRAIKHLNVSEKESKGLMGALREHAYEHLSQVFAKVYKIWRWNGDIDRSNQENPDVIGYQLIGDVNSEGDIDNLSSFDIATPIINEQGVITRRGVGECPIIQAVSLDRNTNIYSSVSGQYKTDPKDGRCEGGLFSINGNQFQVIPFTENIDQEPINVVVGEEITLEFFGYNQNGEQLPLKEIRIDWDGSKSEEKETIIRGNFKNHSPDCSNGSPNYGQTKQACDPKVFKFTHVYSSIGEMSPIVTLIDNWGMATRAQYKSAVGEGIVIRVENPAVNIPAVVINPDMFPEGVPSGTSGNQTFTWSSPEGFESQIVNYKVSSKVYFLDGTISEDTTVQPTNLGKFIPYQPGAKRAVLEVRACSTEGCGFAATETILYRPSQATGLSGTPLDPFFGDTVSFGWNSNTLASHYVVETNLDSNITTSPRIFGNTYELFSGSIGDFRNFKVRVRACNDTACGDYSSSISGSYRDVIPDPVANFSGTPTTVEEGSSVNFVNRSSNSSSWLWNFGDGSTSTSKNPSHTYSNIGTYTVRLTSRNSAGSSDAETKTNYVTVTSPSNPNPIARITVTPSSGLVPLNVLMFGSGSSNVDTYNWDFGDGSSSSSANTNHTFTSDGTYTVTLTVTNSEGSDSATRTVTVNPPPAVDGGWCWTDWAPECPSLGPLECNVKQYRNKLDCDCPAPANNGDNCDPNAPDTESRSCPGGLVCSENPA